MKPSGPGLLFAGRFLITVSISLLVMGSIYFLTTSSAEQRILILRTSNLLLFFVVMIFCALAKTPFPTPSMPGYSPVFFC